MDIKKYQEHALSTVAYKDDDTALDCVLAGLVGEMGEVFELWKKFRRFDSEDSQQLKQVFDKFKSETTKELGDLFWYLVVYAWLWDIDLDSVLQTNIEKLAERKKNLTLHDSAKRVEISHER